MICENGRVTLSTSRGRVIGQVTHGVWPPLAAALAEAVNACCATCNDWDDDGVCRRVFGFWDGCRRAPRDSCRRWSSRVSLCTSRGTIIGQVTR